MGTHTIEKTIESKMLAAGVAVPTITAFLGALRRVIAGERGMVPETELESVPSLLRLDDISAPPRGSEDLLKKLVVVKLNGGLGTGMGLESAKSLLPVKNGDTFLDFIARQILQLRAKTGTHEPAFYLMNSFSTQRDSLSYLQKYTRLASGEPIDFLQNMAPKIDARTFEPASWPAQPDLEWCPPGHGDIFPSLVGSGLLDHLLARGITYMFVSNSDNLGATVDLKLLQYFASEELSFLMEVADVPAPTEKVVISLDEKIPADFFYGSWRNAPQRMKHSFRTLNAIVFSIPTISGFAWIALRKNWNETLGLCLCR